MSRWFQQYGFDPVADGLLVGALPGDAEDVAVLATHGVTRVVSLVADGEYRDGAHAVVLAAYDARGISETRAPSEDYGHLLPPQLERVSGLTATAIGERSVVYLHCRAGWQRSVVAAAATLSRAEARDPLDALRAVMARRRGADPLPHQISDLLRWWSSRPD